MQKSNQSIYTFNVCLQSCYKLFYVSGIHQQGGAVLFVLVTLLYSFLRLKYVHMSCITDIVIKFEGIVFKCVPEVWGSTYGVQGIEAI